MIERHVTFDVFPEKSAEFEKFFIEHYRPAMSKLAGFVHVYLLAEQENANHYQMVICFQSTEESDNWKRSSEHQSLSPILKSFYSESRAEFYRVIA